MKRNFVYILPIVLVVAMWTPSCADSLAPREPYEHDLSVYGLLTPDRDTQSVWVFPIEEVPTLGTPDALEDVTVRSTDLGSGEVHIWQDTVVQRTNGQYEFLYRAPFRAAYDRSYRVEVQRANAAPAWAEVRIPPPPAVRVISASRDVVTIEIIGDVSVMKTEVEYYVRAREGKPDSSYMKPYWRVQERIPGGWRVNTRFYRDQYWISASYATDWYPPVVFWSPCRQLFLGEMRLHALVGDTAWVPPGRALDPYVLSQHGTVENVKNGTGFIGGGYRIAEVLDVPREAVEAACWKYCSFSWDCACYGSQCDEG